MVTTDFALKLDGVSKYFGGLQAVGGVSLAVRPGERRALIGPNGAGKTTLFNLISGSLPVSAGAITLFGRDVTGAPTHRRAAQGLARTFQITNLFADLTVLDNCLLAIQALTRERFAMFRPSRPSATSHRALSTLEAVGLGAVGDVPVRNLSHGEQRQLEIALALAESPGSSCSTSPRPGSRQRSLGSWQGCSRGWIPPSPCS